MKKIFLDGGEDYVKGTKKSEADGVEIDMTTGDTPKENRHGEGMNRTIRSSIGTKLLHSCTPANLWAKCLYAVCDERNRFVLVGCTRTAEELLVSVKATVAHFRTFGCKVWIRVPDKSKKTLDAKACLATLMRSLFYRKYCAMVEDEQSIHTSGNCIMEGNNFSMKRWTNIVMVNKDDLDESVVEDYSRY